MNLHFWLILIGLAVWRNANAQQQSICLSLEHRSKTDRMASNPKYPDQATKIRRADSNYGFYVGYRKKRISIEAGYYKEKFFITSEHEGVAVSGFIGSYNMFPLRIGYHLPIMNIWKRGLSLSAHLGIITARGKSQEDWLTVTAAFPNGADTLFVTTYPYSKNAASFKLWEARIQLQYDVFRHVSVYGGIGVGLGSMDVITSNTEYRHNQNSPELIENQSKGSNSFVNIGLKLRIPVRNRQKN